MSRSKNSETHPDVSYFTGPPVDMPPRLTETEKELFLLLSTGMAYSGNIMRRTIRHDRLTSMNALRFHIWNLRKKIRPYGLEVVCERRPGRKGSGSNDYRMLRLISPMSTSIEEIDWLNPANVRDDNPPKKRFQRC